jgi:PAB-dependent poly(A)-specific ribonuclease subunit 2
MVDEWLIFNDFLVEKTTVEDAIAFHARIPWRTPCVLLYRLIDKGPAAAVVNRKLPRSGRIPAMVFDAPSLSQIHMHSRAPQYSFTLLEEALLPKKGERVAIDTEFVSVQMEQSSIRADGKREVTKEGRQALARVSAIAGDLRQLRNRTVKGGVVFIDDYVLPSEPVVDYLTRFSGLVADDLDRNTSTRYLVPLKTTYLKLRYLVDRGCIFVGHGLKKDFRVINLFVPSDQIIDTVDLFHLPGQRKISLRFLAVTLLQLDIQDETHDSIEDARTALLLHDKVCSLGLNLLSFTHFSACMPALASCSTLNSRSKGGCIKHSRTCTKRGDEQVGRLKLASRHREVQQMAVLVAPWGAGASRAGDEVDF